MASSGGSITLRLAVAGQEEVKAALAALGPAGARALREIEEAQHGPTAGMRALDAAGEGLTDRFKEMPSGAGLFGKSLMAIGPAGLGAAAALGALVEIGAKLNEGAHKSAEWAEGIEKFSERTGVSAQKVQELDFAFDAMGVGAAKGRETIESLNTSIGKIEDNLLKGKSGGKQLALFEAILGTNSKASTQETLKDLGDVTNVIAKIQSFVAPMNAQQRAGVASALKVDPQVLTTLADANDKVEDLIGTAHRFGLIADEDLIHKAAEAGEKFHTAATIIDDEFKVSLAGLAAPIANAEIGLVGLAKDIGDVSRGAADSIGWLQGLIGKIKELGNTKPGQDGLGGPSGFVGWVAQRTLPVLNTLGPIAGPLAQGVGGYIRALRAKGAQDKDIDDIVNMAGNREVDHSHDHDTWPGVKDAAGRAHRGPTADEVAQKTAELLAQADSDLLKAKKAQLTAELSATKDVQGRLTIQAQIGQLDMQQAADEVTRRDAATKLWVDHLSGAKGVSDALKRQAAAAAKAAQAAEQEVLFAANGAAAQKALADLAAARKQTEDDAAKLANIEAQNKVDLLKAEGALVTTMTGRRRIELAIFDAEEDERRSALQRAASAPDSTDDQRAQARAQLAGLNLTMPDRRQAVSNQFPGNAYDAWLQKQKDTLPSLSQEWAQFKVDGIDAFNNSLFDSEGRINSFGSVMHAVFVDLLKDVEQYLLKQAEVGALDGGSPGGGFLGSILGLLGGGNTNAAGAGLSPSLFNTAGLFAGGGFVRGKGTGKSDSVRAWLSDREYVMSADAVAHWGVDMLDAMNGGRGNGVPHFASGGPVGGGHTAAAAAIGGFHYHDNRDMSINAPGADAAALARVAANQQTYAKREPVRVAAYLRAVGLIRK